MSRNPLTFHDYDASSIFTTATHLTVEGAADLAASLRTWCHHVCVSPAPTLLVWRGQKGAIANNGVLRIFGRAVREESGSLSLPTLLEMAPGLRECLSAAFAGKAGQAAFVRDSLANVRSEPQDICPYSFAPISDGLSTEPCGVLFVFGDQSDQTVAAARLIREHNLLHEVYEYAPGFIALADGPEHRFTFANASYRKLVGREDIVGKTVAEVLPEVVRQGFIDLLDTVYQTGEPFIGRGLPIVFESSPDETPDQRYIDTIYHPVRNARGEITGLFAEGHDVTEQVKAQSLASHLQAQLLRFSRSTALESFGSAVAHEINQPLAAAVNYLAVARKAISPEEPKADALADAIQRASHAVTRAGEILQRLRTLDRTGTATARPTELLDMILEAISLVRTANPNLEIVTTATDEVVVVADRVQIQQVIVNLLKNAQEAMISASHPMISISVKTDGKVAIVRVEDHGPGIADENLESLFEWFVTTKRDGTGIGLPISKRIIEAHDGRMWAENLRNGAAFSFTLPLVAKGAMEGE